MKRIVPLLLLLLLFCGCSGIINNPSSQTTTQFKASGEVKTASSLPSQNLPLSWHYDLKNDGLYRTNQITGDTIKISDQDYAIDFVITEDWIYYVDNNQLYRMDNENRKELLASGDDCRQLRLSGSMLYYINSNGINRMNLDGSDKEQIMQSECNAMVLTDKYIFYALDVPEDDELISEPGADDGPPNPIGELHRVDLNGNNDVNLGVMITDLSVYKNIIYFSDSTDNYFYSLNSTTMDKSTVYKGYWIGVPYFGGDSVFFDSDHVFYRMSLKEGTITQLTKAFGISCRGILDGYVYVDINTNDPDVDGLYRIKIDGVNLEKVE